MITKMKNLLATHLTEKTYFDEDDAKVYAKSLQDRFEQTGPIGDTLLEITNMMDFISGKSEGKFKKQLNTLHSRINELESIIQLTKRRRMVCKICANR